MKEIEGEKRKGDDENKKENEVGRQMKKRV